MQESVMQRMWDSAHLSGGNAAYVEELYELYLHDPNAVPEEWRTYFQGCRRRVTQLRMCRIQRYATISFCLRKINAVPSQFRLPA